MGFCIIGMIFRTKKLYNQQFNILVEIEKKLPIINRIKIEGWINERTTSEYLMLIIGLIIALLIAFLLMMVELRIELK